MTTGSARVAIVTGGTRGIGQAITERLAREGHQVIALYRSDDAAATSASGELADTSHPPVTMRADVSRADACRDVVARAMSEYGRIDYLVNNAGSHDDADTASMSDEAWDSVLQTSLSSVFYMTRAVLPHMIAAHFGRIVNITSVGATKGSAWQGNYAAAKAGVHGFSRSVARETAGLGITVNCVAPGPIETFMSAHTDQELQQRIVRAVPMRRMGTPAEVALFVSALVDDLAGFVTGAVIPVDGGLGM
jgi:NAD(P)-dependent dehydrogenase (short-subunit alcohol dehydrogenase family)